MSKKTISLLPPSRPEPCPAVIKVMKVMLEKAEAGELSGVAMVVAYPAGPDDIHGSFGSVYVSNPGEDMIGFIGTLRALEHRIMTQVYIPERDD